MPNEPGGPDYLVVPHAADWQPLPSGVANEDGRLIYSWPGADERPVPVRPRDYVDLRWFRQLRRNGSDGRIRDFAAAYGPLGVTDDGRINPVHQAESESIARWRDVARIAHAVHEVTCRIRGGRLSTPAQQQLLGRDRREPLGEGREERPVSALTRGITWGANTKEEWIAARDREMVARVLQNWLALTRVVPELVWFPKIELPRYRLQTTSVLGLIGLALVHEATWPTVKDADGRLLEASLTCDVCQGEYEPENRRPARTKNHYCGPECARRGDTLSKRRRRQAQNSVKDAR